MSPRPGSTRSSISLARGISKAVARIRYSIPIIIESKRELFETGVNPLIHFVEVGWRQGRRPHPLFDPDHYRKQAPELAETGGNPLIHFAEAGWRNGYDPHPLFSTSFYNERYPDIAAAGINPIVHYIQPWQ